MNPEETPPPLRIYYNPDTNQYRDANGTPVESVNGAPPMGFKDFWDDEPFHIRPVFALIWEGEDHAELLLRAGQWLDTHYPETLLEAIRGGIQPYPNCATDYFEAAVQLNPALHPSNPLSGRPSRTSGQPDEVRPLTRIYYDRTDHEYFDKNGLLIDVVNGIPPTDDELPPNDEALDRRPVFKLTWEGEDHIDLLLVAGQWLNIHFPEKALNCFDAAIQLDPEWWASYDYAGHFLMAQGRFGEAIPYFHKCIEVEPENAKSYLNTGLGYYGIGDLENAVLLIDKAIQYEPKNLTPYLYKLRWLLELKRWPEINDFYEQNHAFVQEAAEARIYYCLALANAGRTEEAEAAFANTSLRSRRRFRAITMEIATLLGLPHRKW